MATKSKQAERRRTRVMTLVERRKGKAWMYGEIAIGAALVLYLVWMLLR